jgi:nucleoside-diphosphate-sugar epimerase
MATLIIGAGLIGSQIARILTEQGEMPVLMDRRHQPEALGEIVDLARVTLVEGDVLRPFDLTKALRDHDITGVIHTAANPMLTLGAQRDPYAAVELNIMGTMNVFEAARIHGIKRVVIASSNVLNHFIAGGEGQGNAAKEEAFPRPTTFYASTKQAVESLGLNYARWYDMEFAAMRYGAVFGPWSGHGGGGPSNVVRDAVHRAVAGEEVMLPSAGIEWVYSKDAALGTVLALRAKGLPSRIFNITMGVLPTPEEFAAAFGAVFPGVKVRIETPAAAAVTLPNMMCVSDLSQARSVLGYTPRFGLIDALRDFAEWMKSR